MPMRIRQLHLLILACHLKFHGVICHLQFLYVHCDAEQYSAVVHLYQLPGLRPTN